MNIHIDKVEGMAVGDQARAILGANPSPTFADIPVSELFYTEAQQVQNLFLRLKSHEKNRDKLLTQLANYAVGEEPVSKLNQFDAEEQAIKNCKDELKKLSLVDLAADVEFAHLKLLALVSLACLSMEQVRSAFAACLPELLTKRVPTNALAGMIRALWTDIPLQTADGRVPRLEFAERIARITSDPQLSQYLLEWVNWYASKLVPNGRSQRDIEKQVSAVYLMIILQPISRPRQNKDNEPEDSDEYRLNVIFWRSEDTEHIEEPWYPLLKGQANGPEDNDDSPTVKLAQLPEVLQKIFHRQQESLVRYNQQLMLEVFVPAPLLGFDIDQWRDPYQRRPSSKITYGARYPCVIRLTERLQDRSLQALWIQRWRYYANDTELDLCSRWIDNTPVDLDSLNVDLLQNGALGLLCLGLSFPPAGSDWEGEFYSFLLDTGMPIGIWPRHIQDPINLAKLKDQINCLHLAALRRRLVDIRLEATTDEKHVGREVILFWDDPERIPALGKRSSSLPTNAGSLS